MASTATWDAYTSDLQDALSESAGWEREKLSAQLKDAEAGRANAYKIASLQAKTQRYGIDQNTMVELKKLTETQRQFDANHALDMQRFGLEQQKFGLSYAQAATDYLSTPDRYAQGMDFRAMADRALTGASGGGETRQGPQPYGTGVTFQPKTEQDFAVLASYGQPGSTGNASSAWSPQRTGVAAPFAPLVQTPTGADPTQAHISSGDTAGQPVSAQPTNDGSTPPDPRVKALKGIIDAVPPSSGPGHDDNDIAVMQAAQALYSTNLQPGTLEAMRPDQRAIYSSFVKRSGRSWNDYVDDYQRSAPGQRSVRAA
jgi:hypothetical protein